MARNKDLGLAALGQSAQTRALPSRGDSHAPSDRLPTNWLIFIVVQSLARARAAQFSRFGSSTLARSMLERLPIPALGAEACGVQRVTPSTRYSSSFP